jgi:hypothetical protein
MSIFFLMLFNIILQAFQLLNSSVGFWPYPLTSNWAGQTLPYYEHS